MKNRSHNPTVNALLAESKWMHGLSRRLVIDAASADDLVQDALAAATGYRGPRPTNVRAWAAAVLKNLARDQARSRSRRAVREAESARPESTPPESASAGSASLGPSSPVETAERQRVLLDAVLSLDEPYRTVTVMRWFDDLSVRTIAKRTDRPAETVKKQLQRAHAQLRKKLESEYGGEGAWAVAMLPLAAATKSAGLMSASFAASAAAMALAASGIYLTLPRAEQAPPQPDALGAIASGTAPAMDSGVTLDRQDPAEGAARTPVRSGEWTDTTAAHHGFEAAPAPVQVVTAPSPHFRGLLFDTAGNPITSKTAPGLRLRLAPAADATGEPFLHSDMVMAPDEEGRVESEATPHAKTRDATISAEGEKLAVLTVGWPDPSNDVCHIVLMPTVNLGGTVVDKQGDPVPGAAVSLKTSLQALSSYPVDLGKRHGGTNAAGFAATTDRNGRFQLQGVPGKDKFLLEASTKDGATGGVRARGRDTDDLVLVVKDWRGDKSAVTGRIVDDRGFPLAGERVHFQSEEATTGEDGRFEFPYGEEQWKYVTSMAACRIWTRTKGGFLATVDVKAESRGPYVLRLPSKMGTISGVLKNAAGHPIPGAEVHLFDGTRTQTRSTPLEMLSSSGSSSERHTDRNGRFEIRSLLDRPYQLRFIGEDSTLVLDAAGVHPDQGERHFVVPEGHYLHDFTGRCVDPMGRPLAGIQVNLCAAKQMPSGQLPWSWDNARGAVTDNAGEFTLPRVSRSGLALRFDANTKDSRPGPLFEIADLDPTGATPIELSLDCTVHLSQAAGSPIAQVRYLNADREIVHARERTASGTRFGAALRPTEDGTYFPCSVSGAARWIQTLDAEGNVLTETPLDLSPMSVNELTL